LVADRLANLLKPRKTFREARPAQSLYLVLIFWSEKVPLGAYVC